MMRTVILAFAGALAGTFLLPALAAEKAKTHHFGRGLDIATVDGQPAAPRKGKKPAIKAKCTTPGSSKPRPC